MSSDKIISFETAKLAKAAGFNSDEALFYNKDGNLSSSESETDSEIIIYANWNKSSDFLYPDFITENVECSAPTQTTIQTWLREKQNFDIFVFKSGNVYIPLDNTAGLTFIDIAKLITTFGCKSFLTFEEALEFIIKESLKSLSNVIR